MAHYASIDENNFVQRVIVAEEDFIKSGVLGDPSRWIQTSYNTMGGSHRNDEKPLRKNFAGVGYYYDSIRDAFIPPKPFSSWVLNEETCLWEAPMPMPSDSEDGGIIYAWDEETLTWVSSNE